MERIEKTGFLEVKPNKRLPVGEKTSKEIVIINALVVKWYNKKLVIFSS